MTRATVGLTFTGVDEETDLDALAGCSGPGIEYAVLAGSSTGRHPRFPGLERILEFRDKCASTGVRSAIHLCGHLARAANEGRHDELEKLCRGFGRIQVNAPSADDYVQDELERLQDRLGAPVIVQHREPFTTSRPFAGPQVSYLLDRSGGRGIAGQESWSEPWPGIACGYAGGLNPQNIGSALAQAAAFNRPTWLDMETGIRTGDRLDMRKVRRIVRIATTGNTG